MGYFALKMKLTPAIRKMIDKIQASKFTLTKQKRKEDGTLVKSRSNINHRITFFTEKKMTESDLIEIARFKMAEMNARSLEAAVKIASGTAYSMGVSIINDVSEII